MDPGAGMCPRPASTMREFTDPDHIDIEIGETFVIVLPENGPGGYLWRAADLPPAVHLRREDDLAPGEGAPGATGEKVFELDATQPGTYTLRFERRRDWEPGADREHTVVVNVGAS
jgi:predicted secreted protein